MNIKEMQDTIESQKEHMEFKDEIYAELMASYELAFEANKDMVAKLKEVANDTNAADTNVGRK